MQQNYTYLALGDSYTIGESLPLSESFPYQTVQLLRKEGIDFHAPEIIARSGWTTDELEAALKKYIFLPKYDFITLLIGVNNQFRGRPAIGFKEELESLIRRSLSLVKEKNDHIILISIPNYGKTPYARTMDGEKIAKEISVYNTITKALSIQFKVSYLELTSAPEAELASESIASDGLHFSSTEYAKWAVKLKDFIAPLVKKKHATA